MFAWKLLFLSLQESAKLGYLPQCSNLDELFAEVDSIAVVLAGTVAEPGESIKTQTNKNS